MCVCGLKKIQVLFLALCKVGLAPPSPSFQRDRRLAAPGPIPGKVQDMLHPEIAARAEGRAQPCRSSAGQRLKKSSEEFLVMREHKKHEIPKDSWVGRVVAAVGTVPPSRGPSVARLEPPG